MFLLNHPVEVFLANSDVFLVNLREILAVFADTQNCLEIHLLWLTKLIYLEKSQSRNIIDKLSCVIKDKISFLDDVFFDQRISLGECSWYIDFFQEFDSFEEDIDEVTEG